MISETNKEFYLEWNGIPTIFKKLDFSILNLKAITDFETIDKLLKINNIEKKKNAFIDFWKSKSWNQEELLKFVRIITENDEDDEGVGKVEI